MAEQTQFACAGRKRVVTRWRCVDCEIDWTGGQNCWNCGKVGEEGYMRLDLLPNFSVGTNESML